MTPANDLGPMRVLERVVELIHRDGRRFTFRVDHQPPLAFWRIECDGRSYVSPMRAKGDETPDFFRSLITLAIIDGGL
jgi:hypothetical protein